MNTPESNHKLPLEDADCLPFLAPLPNEPILMWISRILCEPYLAKRTNSEIIYGPNCKDGMGKIFYFEIQTSNTHLLIEFSGKQLFRGKHTTRMGVLKVWVFLLQKLKNQSFSKTVPAELQIDLREMVQLGMYACVDSAYRGIQGLLNYLSMLSVFVLDKNDKMIYGGTLFLRCKRSSGFAVVTVNTDFAKHVLSPFTYFPVWALRLNGNAFALSEYCFRLLRLNAKHVMKNGFFTIKIETVCNQLGLKSVEAIRKENNRRYMDMLVRPLLKAIQEFNSAANEDKTVNGKIRICIVTPENVGIDEWIQESIRIYVDGDYIANFAKLAQRKELFINTKKDEQIKQAAKRKAKESFSKER